MSLGFVGVVTADCVLASARSLKDKRKPLAGLRASLTRATGCSVCEVDDHDIVGRARLSLSFVGRSGTDVTRLCEVAERVLYGGEFEIVHVDRHIVSVEELLDLAGGG